METKTISLDNTNTEIRKWNYIEPLCRYKYNDCYYEPNNTDLRKKINEIINVLNEAGKYREDK